MVAVKDDDPRIETIIPGNEMLSVSIEYDEDPKIDAYPCLFYSPDMASHEHWHIRMDDQQAKNLRDWLTTYLNKSRYHRRMIPGDL